MTSGRRTSPSAAAANVNRTNGINKLFISNLFMTDEFMCSVFSLQPVFGHRDDADVHCTAVGGQHRGLDLDAGSIGAESRMRMVGSRRLVTGREHDHLASMTVDKINAAREIVADRPASIRRSIDMPEAAAAGRLSGDDHFARPQIYDREARRFFSRARRTPLGLLAGVSSADRSTGRNGSRSARNFSMAHDRQSDFIPRYDGFVGYPFVFRLGVERSETAAVGQNGPRSLRRLSSRLPAKDDLARHPRIGLNVTDLKGNRDDVFDGTGMDVHRRDAGWTGTHVTRTEILFGLGARRKVAGGGFAADPKIDGVFVAVESHVSAGTELGRRRAANALICVGRLYRSGSAIGKEFSEVDFDNLHCSRLFLAGPALNIRPGRKTKKVQLH